MLFPKKVTDNRKKNTKRKITPEVAEEVRKRDKHCVICPRPIQEIHHVFYWLMAQYDEWRNNADRLVWLCTTCHDKLHARGLKTYRDYTIKYLKDVYSHNSSNAT